MEPLKAMASRSSISQPCGRSLVPVYVSNQQEAFVSHAQRAITDKDNAPCYSAAIPDVR